MKKIDFDWDALQTLWDRQGEDLEGQHLISDEEIHTAMRQPGGRRRAAAWWPKVAAAVAVLLAAGSTTLWFPRQEHPTLPGIPTVAYVAPHTGTLQAVQSHTGEASSSANVPMSNSNVVVSSASMQSLSSALPDGLFDDMPTTAAQPMAECVAEVQPANCSKLPNTVETSRLVCVTGECHEADVVVIENHRLIETIEPELVKPTFHNSVIEPILEWMFS